MSERVDRRTFLALSLLAPAVILVGCKDTADKKPKSLLEGATQEDYSASFDQIFEASRNQKDVKFETRQGGPANGLLLIRFKGQKENTKGLLVLEKGYRPGTLLGYYAKDDSARTIDLIVEEEDKSSRILVSTWGAQNALRFLPPEKYTNPEQGIVEPHKLTEKELGPFLAQVWASFNSDRLPPLDQ